MHSIQRAVEQQIRAGRIGAPLIVEGRPFPKAGRRIEIDVRGGTGLGRIVVGHFPFTFSLSSTSRGIRYMLAAARVAKWRRGKPSAVGTITAAVHSIDWPKPNRLRAAPWAVLQIAR